jgi:hypothetical protein
VWRVNCDLAQHSVGSDISNTPKKPLIHRKRTGNHKILTFIISKLKKEWKKIRKQRKRKQQHDIKMPL